MNMKIKNFTIILLMLAFIIFFLAASDKINTSVVNNPIIFFISTGGNDYNSGTIDEPFQTLEGARDYIRKLKKNKRLPKENIVVYIRGGNYYRNTPFVLNNIDSGTSNYKIIYKPYKDEKVTITGGVTLNNSKFQKVTDKNILNRIIDKNARSHIYKYDLSKSSVDLSSLKESILNSPQLLFNDIPMTLSRWPSDSFDLTGNIISSGASKYTFKLKENRPLLWRRSKDIWLFGYWFHNWYDSTVKLNAIDKSNKEISFNQNIPYGIKSNQRYYVFNILEELSKPGQWYLDRKNKIIYLYPPSAISSALVYLSQTTEPFVTMNNTSNVTFEGVTFENARNTAVIINGGKKNIIAGCTIRNISKNAVSINGGYKNGVQSCDIYNTGTGGILINSGNRSTLTPANDYADNNNIYNYAEAKRTYSAAVSLSGVGNRASHNVIHNAPHTAILFAGNDNVIEYNEIYSVVQETDDAGAIYTGRDWTYRGNIIAYNYIHDIQGAIGKFGKTGIYLDDCISGTKVYLNIFKNVYRPMLFGGGRDNIINNNLIFNSDESICFFDNSLCANYKSLFSNLNKVPYKSELWKKRYPKLYEMDSDPNPGNPCGNIVTKNAIYNSKAPDIAPAVIKYGNISENEIISKVDYTTLQLYIYSRGHLKLKLPLTDFKVIPLNKIGNYKDKYR